MATTIQRVDKDTFKQIFRDHWETFTQHQPRYQDRHVQGVIDKMLGCGTPESGYTTYLCPHCLEEKRWRSAARAASVSPAARCTLTNGGLTLVGRSTRACRIATWS